VVLRAVAAVFLSSWGYVAAAALLCAAMGPGSHHIQDRLQDCFIRCELHDSGSWINVQKMLPDAGSTSYRDKIA